MLHVLRSISAGAFAILATTLASHAMAQGFPDDSGNGTRLGIQSLNQSGQVGDVTLFDSGSETRLRISLHGTSGHKEVARIARGKSCDDYDLSQGYSLAPLGSNGVSETLVHAASSKLLSGNYVVVTLSAGKHGLAQSCGSLYT